MTLALRPFGNCLIACLALLIGSPLLAGGQEGAPGLAGFGKKKARIDPLEKVQPEAREKTKKGFVILREGRYWRDISRIVVDLEAKQIFYDYYRNGAAPAVGHRDLSQEKANQMISLCNKIWSNPKDNAEKPNQPLLVGIEYMTSLVLVDEGFYRVISFSTAPLREFEQLYQMVADLVEARE
ncbi:MAG TPA: hypothetical protein VF173_38540 [Thermoanaerobaculia bacterium]|nr:hypothetical protein [Thermoanaerobaculia bacterium]